MRFTAHCSSSVHSLSPWPQAFGPEAASDPTPAERRLWFEYLRDLPHKFTRQKPLGEYIADFYCAAKCLSSSSMANSHFDAPGERYDQRRTDALSAQGVRVIRFTNLEVMQQFEAVCQRIEDTLKT